jgi:photosystem II stability/assembly factor-like uncharacterized protein
MNHIAMTVHRAFSLAPLITLCAAATVSGQWVPQSSGTEAELRGLSVVSARSVWASGQRGTVIHTLNGGSAWNRDAVPGATALDLRAIAATSTHVAHAMSIGDSSRIFRTTDGGRNWSTRFVSRRKGSFFDAIQFWDAQNGIAVSDPVDGKFLIVTTSDGGDSWQEVPAEGLPPALANEGAFAASGSCLTVFGRRDVWFATGGASVARVFHSSDRGRTWTVSETPIRSSGASQGIFSVAFRDAKHGVAAGGDYAKPALGGRNIAFTSDGGHSWTLLDSASSPQGFRSAVTYVPGMGGRTLVAVGLNGTDVSRDGGTTWTLVDTTAYNSVQFGSRTVGFAVGPKGRVARMELKR